MKTLKIISGGQTGVDRAALDAKGNLRFEQASCTALPHADRSFDLIVAFEVIEHLEDWRGFLLEMRRLLAANGQFIVSTPNKLYYTEHCQIFDHTAVRAGIAKSS